MVVATFRAGNSLLFCLRDSLNPWCSSEASDWLREIYRLYLEPEAAAKGCHLGMTSVVFGVSIL